MTIERKFTEEQHNRFKSMASACFNQRSNEDLNAVAIAMGDKRGEYNNIKNKQLAEKKMQNQK
jgi:hypothetical protein